MYDISKKMNKFYKKHVVLSASNQNELHRKRKLNLKRLEDGLKEYNEEEGTNYQVIDSRTQGSMMMSTIIQSESNDYDIDVAIVFDEENISDIGSLKIRRIVADSLSKKTKQFNTEPEIKTSCVRVKYNDGYHIDFAIFKKGEEIYYHSGEAWTKRSLKGLEEWFNIELENKGENFRKIIRLIKMFVKSREDWNHMPSGLVLSILCAEEYSFDERLDLLFYNTMKNIVTRLETSIYVCAPVDNSRKLITRKSDEERMEKFRDRLKENLAELDIVFGEECLETEAISAWGTFFAHDYWKKENEKILESVESKNYTIKNYDNTEQFVEDVFDIDIQYSIDIKCKLSGNGINGFKSIQEYKLIFRNLIAKNLKVDCEVIFEDKFDYDSIYWKVRNQGEVAIAKNDIRGQIYKRGNNITEYTRYRGDHFIECYIIKENKCIAFSHVDINIGELE